MATGRLGAVDLIGGVMTSLYTVPTNTLSTLNLNICNRNATQISARIAVIDGALGSLSNADYIEYDTAIYANGVLERTGIVLQAGHTLVVMTDISNVSAVCWGFEDSTV